PPAPDGGVPAAARAAAPGGGLGARARVGLHHAARVVRGPVHGPLSRAVAPLRGRRAPLDHAGRGVSAPAGRRVPTLLAGVTMAPHWGTGGMATRTWRALAAG